MHKLIIRALDPSAFLAKLVAPLSNKNSITSEWPFSAAKSINSSYRIKIIKLYFLIIPIIRAVNPFELFAFISFCTLIASIIFNSSYFPDL